MAAARSAKAAGNPGNKLSYYQRKKAGLVKSRGTSNRTNSSPSQKDSGMHGEITLPATLTIKY